MVLGDSAIIGCRIGVQLEAIASSGGGDGLDLNSTLSGCRAGRAENKAPTLGRGSGSSAMERVGRENDGEKTARENAHAVFFGVTGLTLSPILAAAKASCG